LLDTLIFAPIEQEETRNESLLAGQQDILYDITLQDVAILRAQSQVRVVATAPDDQPYLCYFQLSKPPFNNPKLRQAFSTAIDREGFVSKVLAGLGAVAYSPFAKQSWAFDSSLVGKYQYNLSEAARLLTEAGYPGGRGLIFDMLVPNVFPQFLELTELIQGAFTTLGAKVSITQLDAAVWFDQFSSGKYDVLVNTDVDHASDPALTFAQPYLWLPGSSNLSDFVPSMAPGYLQWIDEADKLSSKAERKVLYDKAQAELMDEALTAMVAFTSIAHALSNKVEGFVPATQFHQRYDQVWLKS
jgi:peptide/nickel transport system substrate-binding protein